MMCGWFKTGLLMAVLLLVLAVNWSFAINCYICDSTVNPKCANLTDRAMKPELCTYEKLVSDGTGDGTGSGRTSWLMTVSELHYFKDSSPVEIPMVCQKIVGTDEQTQQQSTVRRCQLENVQPCDLDRNQIIKSGGKTINHCSVCGTNGCNGAQRPAVSAPLSVTVGVALVVVAAASRGILTGGGRRLKDM